MLLRISYNGHLHHEEMTEIKTPQGLNRLIRESVKNRAERFILRGIESPVNVVVEQHKGGNWVLLKSRKIELN